MAAVTNAAHTADDAKIQAARGQLEELKRKSRALEELTRAMEALTDAYISLAMSNIGKHPDALKGPKNLSKDVTITKGERQKRSFLHFPPCSLHLQL